MVESLREMSIAIDVWDDVFSDFDPRPLAERTLSEDFINELKKRYRETRRGKFVISFYAPLALKDEKTEKTVIHRLKEHFKYRSLQVSKDIIDLRVRGVLFVLCGIIFLTFLLLSAYFQYFHELTLKIMEIIFMPLGWFGIWEGFSKIVDAGPRFNQEKILFQKLANAEYRFYYN